MATRWSRLRGELYLARKSDDGEVSDVEEHTAVLWLGAIGPRRAVGLDLARRLWRSSRATASRGGEEMKMARRVRSGRRGAASRHVCDARRRTARGQRGQPAFDARRTRVRRFLKNATTVASIQSR